MAHSVEFNDQELELVLELLERERSDLPAEIHHTMTSDYKDKLSRRLETVNGLLQRLRKS